MRLATLLSTLVALALASQASAHDFWAGTPAPGPDGRLTVFIGYGHNFPAGEAITAEDFAARYTAPKLLAAGGEVKLAPGEDPYSFVTEAAPAEGTYLALVESKPSFGGMSPSGWVAKSKREDPTVTRCSYGGNFGKAVVNVGGAADDKAASKVVGQKLEIVPLANPAKAKVGEGFPVKVLFDGKPLPRAQVGGFFAGFTTDNSAFAFSASTNREGEVSIIPLRPGQWLIKAGHNYPYADQAECDTERWGATLAVTIPD